MALSTFRWLAPTEPYQVVDCLPTAPERPTRARCLIDPAQTHLGPRVYLVEERDPALFRQFMEVPATEAGILAFANQYGMLGIDERVIVEYGKGEKVEDDGECVHRWIDEIAEMRRCVLMWDAFVAGNPSVIREDVERSGQDWSRRDVVVIDDLGFHVMPAVALRGPAGSAWRLSTVAALQTAVQSHLAPNGTQGVYSQSHLAPNGTQGVYSRLLYDEEVGRLRLVAVPTSLLSAMWMQFAISIDTQAEYRRCELEDCRRWFRAAPKVERRRRRFCSDNCRAKASYRKGRATQ